MMTHNVKSLVALALTAVLFASAAPAQQPGFGAGGGMNGAGMNAGGGMMMNGPGRGRFPMIDVDQNGVVSADEAAAAAEEVFAAMDGDDNAALTMEEYMAVRMGPQNGWNKTRQDAREQEKAGRFAEMDLDKNKAVSQAEFMTSAKARFAAADGDKDGTVSPWEWRSQQWN